GFDEELRVQPARQEAAATQNTPHVWLARDSARCRHRDGRKLLAGTQGEGLDDGVPLRGTCRDSGARTARESTAGASPGTFASNATCNAGSGGDGPEQFSFAPAFPGTVFSG